MRHEEQRSLLLSISAPGATGKGKRGGEAALARVVVGRGGQPHGAEEAAVDLVMLLFLWLLWVSSWWWWLRLDRRLVLEYCMQV